MTENRAKLSLRVREGTGIAFWLYWVYIQCGEQHIFARNSQSIIIFVELITVNIVGATRKIYRDRRGSIHRVIFVFIQKSIKPSDLASAVITTGFQLILQSSAGAESGETGDYWGARPFAEISSKIENYLYLLYVLFVEAESTDPSKIKKK